jgi:hypothetical protein
MAEGLAVVGIVANIVQLVDFGSRVLKRLEEYQSQLGGLPDAFHHIKVELCVLLDTLRQTKEAIDAGSMQDGSKKALLPAVKECEDQVQLLEDLIIKVLPSSNDSRTTRGWKALRSLHYDGKVEKIRAVIRGYVQALANHAATSSRPLAGMTPLTF